MDEIKEQDLSGSGHPIGTRRAGGKLGVVNVAAADERVAVTGPLLAEAELGEQLQSLVDRDETEKRSVVVLVTGRVEARDLARATLKMAAAWITESKKVAVVDLFLGDGAFENPLSGQKEEGVGDHLLFGASLKSIARETPAQGLTLMPAGAGCSELDGVLSGEKMRELISTLRREYDAVFLCGAIAVEGEERHPLVDWVDGWVGVVGEGREASGELGSSFGWVEITRPRPEPVAERPQRKPEQAPVSAPPVKKAPPPAAAPRKGRDAAAVPKKSAVVARPARWVAIAVLIVVVPLGIWWVTLERPQERARDNGGGGRPAGQAGALFPTPATPVGESPESAGPVFPDEPPTAQAEIEEQVSGGQVRADAELAERALDSPAQGEAEIQDGVPGLDEPPVATPVPDEAAPEVPEEIFAVHISSYRSIQRAESEVGRLIARGYEAEVVETDLGAKGVWYRVHVGRYVSREEARGASRRLKEEEGFEYARVVKTKSRSSSEP